MRTRRSLLCRQTGGGGWVGPLGRGIIVALLLLATLTAGNQAEAMVSLFSDNFFTSPDTNGKWRIYRNGTSDRAAYWDPTGHELYLTTVAGGAPAMFANYRLKARHWEASFRYKVGGGINSGGDGFTFMFYKNETPFGLPGVLPGGGFVMGFEAYQPNGTGGWEPVPGGSVGYGIEFDGWNNGAPVDPSGNHIALDDSTVSNHLISTDDLRTEDNVWHTAWVLYDYGHVIVSIDGQTVLDYTIPSPNYTYSGIGFSAGTGLATNDHIIDDFVLQGHPTLTVTKAGDGSGTVVSSPPGINDCGTDCQEYPSFTQVSLTATPAADSGFAGWSGDPDCADGSVTMDADKSCTATFTLNTHTLTVATAGTGSGSVTGLGIACPGDCTETYPSVAEVTLTANPAANSTFAGWSGDSDCLDGIVTMDANKSCIATFTAQYTLTVATAGTGTGTVTGPNIACPGDCSEVYQAGTPVSLAAGPGANSTFYGWSGDADCTDGSVTMDANKFCVATFTLIQASVPPPAQCTPEAVENSPVLTTTTQQTFANGCSYFVTAGTVDNIIIDMTVDPATPNATVDPFEACAVTVQPGICESDLGVVYCSPGVLGRPPLQSLPGGTCYYPPNIKFTC